MLQYNDYELIYLIQSEFCEPALKIMFKKYELLIYKYLHLYNVPKEDYDDYIQEAKILMYEAISKFDESKNKTFTRFYELILKRKIIKLNKKLPRYEIIDDFSRYKDENLFIEIEISNLTNLETVVFQKYFIQNQKISYIAETEKKSIKQIYNAIYRIREKFKNNML